MKNIPCKMSTLCSYLPILLLFSMIVVGCEMDEAPRLFPDPPVTLSIQTTTAKSITTTSAHCGGIITSDGETPVLTKGICWSTSTSPTIADNVIEDVLDSDTIQVTLTELMVYTRYYYRAFVTSNVGTKYGEETSFTTQGGTVTDIDGNVYHTISIGSQVWMLENLKVTRYRNGDSISLVKDSQVWQASSGAYCYYDNNTDNKEIYGDLYNWWAVNDSRHLAPEGWHVPGDAEWAILGAAAGSGGSLKEKNMAHWKSPNTGATNESGFTGLPGGYRDWLGSYTEVRKRGCFWSSTPFVDLWGNGGAWYSYLSYDANSAEVWRVLSSYGFSVRCVKD